MGGPAIAAPQTARPNAVQSEEHKKTKRRTHVQRAHFDGRLNRLRLHFGVG